MAKVYMGQREKEKDTVAVKVVPVDNGNVPIEELEEEVRLMRSLEQKNILPLVEAFVFQSSLCILTPMMDYGSVSDIIHAKFSSGLPEMVVGMIVVEVLEAVHYLHSRDMIHRGIRCSHILVSSKGRVCLSGLWAATSIMHNGRRAQKLHDFSPKLKANLLWLAPEVLQQNIHGYHQKSDVYSVGISVCEMANGFPPFADMEPMQMLLEKLRGTTPRLLDETTLSRGAGENVAWDTSNEQRRRKFSESFHNFAELCLKPSQNSRPSVKELLLHSFLKQGRKSKQGLCDLLLPLKPLTFQKVPSETSQKDMKVDGMGNQDTGVRWTFE